MCIHLRLQNTNKVSLRVCINMSIASSYRLIDPGECKSQISEHVFHSHPFLSVVWYMYLFMFLCIAVAFVYMYSCGVCFYV